MLAAGPIKFCMPEQLLVSDLIHATSTNILSLFGQERKPLSY